MLFALSGIYRYFVLTAVEFYSKIEDRNKIAFVGESRVTQREKQLERILRGASDADIIFDEMRRILLNAGFQERIRGSHHISRKKVWMKY